ncbi:MAG TPA: DinB family protein [Ktedonobacterales bacterium]|jgi:uncharacterized damage-inducible protein DinB
MDPAVFREIYAYTFWADRQLWTCIEQLTEEQFTQPVDFSRGSLREQCIHIMGVEFWWFRFLSTGNLEFLDASDYPTRAAVRARWDTIEAEVTRYLASVTSDDLTRLVKPEEVWDKEDQPVRAWQAMFQVANHSTDHRAQTLATIHQLGGPNVEQDYLTYLDQQRATSSNA